MASANGLSEICCSLSASSIVLYFLDIMRFLTLFLIMVFAVSEKALCASSELFHIQGIVIKIYGEFNNNLIDGIEIHPYLNDDKYIIKRDFSKSQLRMTINANEYDLNEPIYVRFFLKNLSNDNFFFYKTFDNPYGYGLSLQIVYEDGSPVEKTQLGANFFPQIPKRSSGPRIPHYLCPGREMEIYRLPDTVTLESVYQLTQPGKYRITALLSYSPTLSMDREQIKAEPMEIVIRDKQYKPPLNPIEPKDQWGNDFFYTTKFRLAFDPSKDQHCFHQDEPIDLLLYTIDHELWRRTPPPKNEVPLFALDRISYRGVRLVLFTPEGRRISKVLSSPGDAPDTCAELNDGILDLRKVFDLSTPGKYRLSGELRSMKPGQQFVPPLESNEIEFEIEGDF